MSDIYRDSIFWVEVERISPNPYQPRREFNEEKLNGLAESIRMYGLLQPLTVTRKETAKDDGSISVEYELIAGERRLRASKVAGLSQVPVIIRSGEDTDQMKLELAIIENLQREDLNPGDRAKAFLKLHKEFDFTHSQIGKKVGRSREYVSNTLRLLTLPDSILQYLSEGRISEGHTRPLLMLKDKPEEQAVLAKEILLKKLTVRESEALARRSAQDRVTPKYKVNPEILSLEKKLTEKLGTRVQIEQKEVGGKLVISFFSAEDLATLLDNMRLESERSQITRTFDGNPTSPKENLSDTINNANNADMSHSHNVFECDEGTALEKENPSNEIFDEQVHDMNIGGAVKGDMGVTNGHPAQTTPKEIASNNTFTAGTNALTDNTKVSVEESVVTPSENRPFPESENNFGRQSKNEQMKNSTFVQNDKMDSAGQVQENISENKSAVSKIVDVLTPRQVAPAAVEAVNTDEDPDLYSIKNFSI